MQTTHLKVSGFKSLRDVSVPLHPLTILVGANGSGKSNLLEVLRVLQGLSLGLTVDETLDGVTRPGVKWNGIRGGTENVRTRLDNGSDPQIKILVEVSFDDVAWSGASYQCTFRPTEDNEKERWMVVSEEFLGHTQEGSSCVLARQLESDAADHGSFGELWSFESSLGSKSTGHISQRSQQYGQSSTFLSQQDRIWDEFVVEDTHLSGNEEEADEFRRCRLLLRTVFAEHFRSFRLFRLLPDNLREAWPDSWSELDESGEGLGPVIRRIIQQDSKRTVLLEWLTELLPLKVTDINVSEPSPGKFSIELVESVDDRAKGTRRPAEVLSDGTLHFLGLLAALLGAGNGQNGSDASRLFGLEDIEENLHPSRLNTLVEFLERMTSRRGEAEPDLQVLATTHAPSVLDAFDRNDLERIIYFWRDSETLETKTKPISEFSNLDRIIDGGIPLGELHEEDWFAGEVE